LFGSRPLPSQPKPLPEMYGPPAPSPRPKIPLTRAQKTMRMTCERFNITKEQLIGPCRRVHLVDARQFVAVRLHRDFGLSTTAIGRLLNRDHSSIIHLLRRSKREA
jgi:chromosomal replication initiation ATPase DnaA